MAADGVIKLSGISHFGDDFVVRPFQRHTQEQGALQSFV